LRDGTDLKKNFEMLKTADEAHYLIGGITSGDDDTTRN